MVVQPIVSGALVEFREGLDMASRLAKLESKYRDPPTPNSAPTVQALRGAATVLMIGSFERFLRSAFEEHLSLLASSPPPVPFQALPEKLRINSVFESLWLTTQGPHHMLRSAQSGARRHRLADVSRAAAQITAGLIDPRALSATKSNPNARTVETMFGRLGVERAFVEIRPAFDRAWHRSESANYVRDKLDQIVNTRHLVAHTATALNITRSDLRDWPRFLDALAQAIDERVQTYTGNVIAGVDPP